MSEQPMTVETSPGLEVDAHGRLAPPPEPPMTPEEVLARIDALGLEMRKVILRVKKLPRDMTLEPYQDLVRCLSQAQTNLQAGFMWLRRSVKQPREF